MSFNEFLDLYKTMILHEKVLWWLKWWHNRECDTVEINDAKYNVGTIDNLYKMLIAEG